jgi:hypothetical protein
LHVDLLGEQAPVDGRDSASGKAEGSWPAENGSAMILAG